MFVARSSLVVCVLALAAAISQAFLPATTIPRVQHRQRVAPLQMGLFDALKKGFENEDMKPAPNAGLKNVRTKGVGVWGGEVEEGMT